MGEGKDRSFRGEGGKGRRGERKKGKRIIENIKIGNSAKKGITINKVIINRLASDWSPDIK
jgi:hypothetical protein